MRRIFPAGLIVGVGLAGWISWRPLTVWADAAAVRVTSYELRGTEGAQPESLLESFRPTGVTSAESGSSRDFSPEVRNDPAQDAQVTPDRSSRPVEANTPLPEALSPVSEPVTETVTTQSTPPAESTPAPTPPQESSPDPRPEYSFQLLVQNHQYQLEHDTSLTVLGLMQALSSQGLSYTSERYDYGEFITGVNGVANSPSQGKYWTYTVNGAPATVGADQYQLKSGDVVVWSYS